jgi:hypothetical protein
METLTPAEEERLKAASITPMETIEAPRVGIDDEATTYLLQQAEKCRQEIREAEEAGKPIANEGYVKHWSQTGVELVAQHHGQYVVDLTDYRLSTLTGIVAGGVSFRGKVVSYSPLLDDELKEEAYSDMEPAEMIRYAGRIQREALAASYRRLSIMAFKNGADGAREWCEEVQKATADRLEAEGYEKTAFIGYMKDGVSAEYTADEELAGNLLCVLDAARWLRFWAGLGHSMHAWY